MGDHLVETSLVKSVDSVERCSSDKSLYSFVGNTKEVGNTKYIMHASQKTEQPVKANKSCSMFQCRSVTHEKRVLFGLLGKIYKYQLNSNFFEMTKKYPQ